MNVDTTNGIHDFINNDQNLIKQLNEFKNCIKKDGWLRKITYIDRFNSIARSTCSLVIVQEFSNEGKFKEHYVSPLNKSQFLFRLEIPRFGTECKVLEFSQFLKESLSLDEWNRVWNNEIVVKKDHSGSLKRLKRLDIHDLENMSFSENPQVFEDGKRKRVGEQDGDREPKHFKPDMGCQPMYD